MTLDPARTAHDPIRPTLIVLSHLRWDFVFQRPQHLLTRAARDFDTIVVEEPIWGDHDAGVADRVEPSGVRVVQPVLRDGTRGAEVVDHQRMIVEALIARAGPGPVWLWYYTPMALAFTRGLPADLIVFDKMDELSAFRNAPAELIALEAELMTTADVVFTGGASMHEAAAHRHANIHCFPSSIDAQHFGRAIAPARAEPADQAAIARPRIGFFGVIDERFDIDLLRDLAALKPDWQFVMLGPVAKIDPARLPRAGNIHWLGSKDYAELPAYLGGWDAGVMPFAINDATRFISPTKTPEFLAAGLPVVSTAIRDVVRPYGDEGLVAIADDAAGFAAALDRLFARDADELEAWRRAVDARLAGGSWDRTWADMAEILHAAAAGPASFQVPRATPAPLQESVGV